MRKKRQPSVNQVIEKKLAKLHRQASKEKSPRLARKMWDEMGRLAGERQHGPAGIRQADLSQIRRDASLAFEKSFSESLRATRLRRVSPDDAVRLGRLWSRPIDRLYFATSYQVGVAAGIGRLAELLAESVASRTGLNQSGVSWIEEEVKEFCDYLLSLVGEKLSQDVTGDIHCEWALVLPERLSELQRLNQRTYEKIFKRTCQELQDALAQGSLLGRRETKRTREAWPPEEWRSRLGLVIALRGGDRTSFAPPLASLLPSPQEGREFPKQTVLEWARQAGRQISSVRALNNHVHKYGLSRGRAGHLKDDVRLRKYLGVA